MFYFFCDFKLIQLFLLNTHVSKLHFWHLQARIWGRISLASNKSDNNHLIIMRYYTVRKLLGVLISDNKQFM